MDGLAVSGLALLAAAAHPFSTYPVSLWIAAKLMPRSVSPAGCTPARPRFSLCTSAHNEAKDALSLAENRLRVAQGHEAEVLIYDDDSDDGTADILTSFADRIRFVRGFERHGKSAGMNQLVALAQGDILVFSDANVRLAEDVLDRLCAYFSDPGIGCVCGHLVYTNGEDSAMAETGAAYWRFEETLKRLETRSGSAIGADGSLFAIRKTLHRPVPEDLIDDMYLSLCALADGARVVQAHDVLAFERSATKAPDEFRRKARIACQAMNVHRALWPRLKRLDLFERYKYLSHKWLRWFSPFTATLGLALFLAALLMAPGPAVMRQIILDALAVLVLAVLSWGRLRRRLVSVVIAFAGVGLGLIQYLGGARYRTWTPAASVR